MSPTDLDLSLSRVADARAAAYRCSIETPIVQGSWLGAAVGGYIELKAEALQRTGSFKVRGVSVRLADVSDGARAGVVAASAGNHAHALAYVARLRGMPCHIFMPRTASISKARAVLGQGATLDHLDESVDGCMEHARRFAAKTGATLVHPFDDPLIILGQATLGLELNAQLPDAETVILPVGGGGLAGGVAAALKNINPAIRVIGVQAEVCAPFVDPTHASHDVRFALADGIAIKRPGVLTQPLIERYVDEMYTVGEDAIAEAIVALLQNSKLVVEGAGAVGVAALLNGSIQVSEGESTVVVLSGGNIDLDRLTAATRLHEIKHHTNLHVITRVPDHPGGLAKLLNAVAEVQANVLSIEHVRDAGERGFHETGVELVMQTRGEAHREAVLDALRSQGWDVSILSEGSKS